MERLRAPEGHFGGHHARSRSTWSSSTPTTTPTCRRAPAPPRQHPMRRPPVLAQMTGGRVPRTPGASVEPCQEGALQPPGRIPWVPLSYRGCLLHGKPKPAGASLLLCHRPRCAVAHRFACTLTAVLRTSSCVSHGGCHVADRQGAAHARGRAVQGLMGQGTFTGQ